jgi:hypothetical protein
MRHARREGIGSSRFGASILRIACV